MSSSTTLVRSPVQSKSRFARLTRGWREATPGERIFFAVAYIVLSSWAVVSIFPLYWMVTTALKPPDHGDEPAAGVDSDERIAGQLLRGICQFARGALDIQQPVDGVGGHGYSNCSLPRWRAMALPRRAFPDAKFSFGSM